MSFNLIAFYPNYVLVLANWNCVKQSPNSHEKFIMLASTFGNALIPSGLLLSFGFINEKIVRGRGEDVLEERSGLYIKYGVRKSHLTLEKPGSLVGITVSRVKEIWRLLSSTKLLLKMLGEPELGAEQR